MSTETELTEVQEKHSVSSENVPQEEQYKLFDFFKEHNGFLVTCISALIATMSVIFHFAVGRMNYAYLEYWDIASIHANNGNQNELYTVVCSFLFLLSLMLIHGLLSGTSDAFRYYNKILSRMNWTIRRAQKTRKKLQKKMRKLTKRLDRLSLKERDDPIAKEIMKEIEEHEADDKEGQSALKGAIKARWIIRLKVFFEIVVAVVVSYLLGSLFLVLIESTGTIAESLRLTRTVAFIVIFDLLIYFLPAYFKTRCSRKQYEKENTVESIAELIDSGIPDFPMEKVATKGIKTMLSDGKLKAGLVRLITVTIILLFAISAVGTTSAEQKRNFPIYDDGANRYAIVYFSGSTVFMEEASYQDGTITIETAKQRIITTDDLSYNMVSFDNVIINRTQNTQVLEDDTSAMKDIISGIGEFFEKISTKLKEVLTPNEGSVSGTECQPTAGN